MIDSYFRPIANFVPSIMYSGQDRKSIKTKFYKGRKISRQKLKNPNKNGNSILLAPLLYLKFQFRFEFLL